MENSLLEKSDHQSNKDSSDEATDAGGDANYSTAPSSPDLIQHHKSYENAIQNNPELLWEWHSGPPQGGGGGDSSTVPSTHSSIRPQEMGQSPPVPKHVILNKTKGVISSPPLSIPTSGGGGTAVPEVINANPYHVQVGFDTTPRSLETTKLSSLPGTNNVITSPPPIIGQPHPQHTTQRRSIEDIDKARRHYVPPSDLRAKSLDQSRDYSSPERDSTGFCLDLGTLRDYVATPPISSKLISSLSMGDDPLSINSNISSINGHHDNKEMKSGDTKRRSLSFDMKDVFHESEEDGTSVSSEELYSDFLKLNTCYDLIPDSTKLVVFDTRLKVKKAFYALVINGVRSAPLWDSETRRFVGMLTITDFIKILRTYYKSPIVGMDELEEQTIQTWRETVANVKSTLIQIDPLQSLYEAVKVLVQNKIHRLPIIDRNNGNALYIATHKRILHYMYHSLIDKKQPSYMKQSLQELGIGSYRNIATVTSGTPIITALNKFTEHRISALPIVDNSGKVTDIYAKFDVINLAAERTYNNLDVSLRDALKHRAEGFEGVLTCNPNDTLEAIIKKIVDSKVHRLVIVNEERHVIGVLSLSDILRFLVLTPHS